MSTLEGNRPTIPPVSHSYIRTADYTSSQKIAEARTNISSREEPHSQSTLNGGVSWELTQISGSEPVLVLLSASIKELSPHGRECSLFCADVHRAAGISPTNKMHATTIPTSQRTDSETNPVFTGQMYQQTGWNNTPLFRNRVPCSTKPQDCGAKERVEQVEQGNYVCANKETNCNLCSRDEGNVITLFQLFRGGRRHSRNAIIWNRVPCSTLFHSTPIGEVIAW